MDPLFVFAELHFGDAFRVRQAVVFDCLERPDLQRLVVHVEAGEFPARFRKRTEIGGERDAREFPFEIGSEAFTVFRMVQNRVEVMEDTFAGDGGIGVARSKLLYNGVFEMGEREDTGNRLVADDRRPDPTIERRRANPGRPSPKSLDQQSLATDKHDG